MSDNGWTTNKLGVQWVKHFNAHTKARTVGTYRLLILDGHESHHSVEFEDYCKENKIITLCMPAHASHLLQPLDVGCFAPLKVAYGRQIEDLMRNQVTHIDKHQFFPAFAAAFKAAIIESNIQGGFRGSGLLPFNPDVVLSKLDIRLHTPSPSPSITGPWESRTPNTHAELASQTELIKGKIIQHQHSSPTPITDAVDQFLKGAHHMAAQLTFVKSEKARLRKANEEASKRKSRKRKRIHKGGILTSLEGQDLNTQINVDIQLQAERRASKRNADGSEPKKRRCKNCNEIGHNSRTCKKDTEDTEN